MRWVKLEECCTVQGGATPKRNVGSFWGEGLDWFTPKDLSSLNTKEIGRAPEQVTDEGLNSCSAKLIPANSLLLSSRAPIGHLAITTQDCCTNQGFQSLIPKQGVVDIEYLYFVMKWSVPRLQDMGRGATFKEISKAIVKGFEIPLPPLEEQNRIAGILDEADRLRKKTQALIDKYDELAQSIFLDMFGDPVTNPKGWEVRTVDECCLVTDYVANGSFASLKANVKYNYDKDFAVLVRTTDNTKGWNGDYVYVPESSFQFLSKSELSKGDLIIANVGDPGKCFLCPDLGQPMTLGPNSILVRSLVEKLNQSYLYHLFASSSGQKMIDRICSATAQKKFNKTSFRALEIPVPDAKTLEKFGQVIETHERQIGYEKNQLNTTEALFNALLQKAFKGELT